MGIRVGSEGLSEKVIFKLRQAQEGLAKKGPDGDPEMGTEVPCVSSRVAGGASGTQMRLEGLLCHGKEFGLIIIEQKALQLIKSGLQKLKPIRPIWLAIISSA